MPAIVGGVKISSVGGSGVVIFGDTLYISPKSTSKTFAGAGSFSTGDFQFSATGPSATLTSDNDVGGVSGDAGNSVTT